MLTGFNHIFYACNFYPSTKVENDHRSVETAFFYGVNFYQEIDFKETIDSNTSKGE